MADNISIAADDQSSVYHQRVIQEVQVAAVPADQGGRDLGGTVGAAAFVENRPRVIRTQLTPTISTSIYAAGDAVGGLLTFTSTALATGGTAYLESVVLLDKDREAAAGYELWLFDRTFTAMADNAAWDPSDADLLNSLGFIEIVAADGAQTATTATLYTWGQTTDQGPYPLVLNGTSLFGQLVTRGTPTFTTTSDIVVTATFRQN